MLRNCVQKSTSIPNLLKNSFHTRCHHAGTSCQKIGGMSKKGDVTRASSTRVASSMTSLIKFDNAARIPSPLPMTSSVGLTMPCMTSPIKSSIRSVNTSSTTPAMTSPKPMPHVCGENLHCVPRVGKDGLVDHQTLSATTLVDARLDDERRVLTVSWNDEEVTDYPYLWLRDSCQCEQCFDEGPCARRLLIHELDIEAKPVHIQTDGTTQQITLIWSDGHRSDYRYKWLLARSFKPDKQVMRARWNGRSNQQLWDASFIDNIPTLSYDKVMNDKRAQYEWITLLEEVGFVLLKGAPVESGQILKIGREIGFCRMTNYGDISVVQTKHNPSNLAYTTGTLMLHTDLAYYIYLPGMQMMHCIRQASGDGGKSLFVDGFLVAKQMREQNPEQFKLLTETVFDFYDIGSDYLEYHQMSRHPTIKLDEEGNVMRIVYSTHSRDSFLRVPLPSVEPIYKALHSFTQLLYDPKNVVPLKLQPGDICCFNNWRVLHGRIGYEMKPGESRLLEHGYIDWDEMHSRRRVLKARLGVPDEDY